MGSHRELFHRLGGHPPARYPPWTATDFTEGCIGCAACVEACPEGVLKFGTDRLVELDLSSTDYMLCGECASRREVDLFDGTRPAFPWITTIGGTCLALAEIHCHSCQDACEPAVIHFRPTPGGVALAELDNQRYNGCDACLAPCPSQAIQLYALSTKESPRHI